MKHTSMKKICSGVLCLTLIFGTVSCASTSNKINEGVESKMESSPVENKMEAANIVPQKYEKSIKKMMASLKEDMAQSGVPSVSILVLENGDPIYSELLGTADKVNHIPLREDTLYNIGSISKVYLAAAVLKLQQDGKLHLDDPITKYIPDFKMADPRYEFITVKMLLNHSSGLPGIDFNSTFLVEKDTNKNHVKELLRDLEDEDLKSNPGDYMIYCNEGFILAQCIVETVSGTHYGTYLKDTFFKPMGLTSSYLSSDEALKDDSFSRAYDQEGNLFPREIVIEAMAGTGGLTTTAGDLAMFGDKILKAETGILDEESIALLRENQAISTKPGDESKNNALGWDDIDPRIPEIQVFKKGGGTTQYHTQLIVIPDENITIVGLSQKPSSIYQIMNGFVYDLLQEKGVIQTKESALEIPEEADFTGDVREYTGVYNVAGDAGPQTIMLNIEGNRLNMYLFIVGNWIPTNSLVYREDGNFWSEQTPFAEYELYHMKEINEKSCLLKTIKTDQYQYSLVYAQKLEAGQNNEGWVGLNNSVWLLSNIYRNNLDFGLLVAPFTIIEELEGYFTFVMLTPFKMTDPNTADIVSEVSNGAGKLIHEDGKITYRGNTYINSKTIPLFDVNNMNEFTLAKENFAQWYFIPEDIRLTLHTAFSDVRMIIFDGEGTQIFDNISQKGTVHISANSFIVFTGKEDAAVNLTIQSNSNN